jgi:hypothetical protein
MAGQALGSEGRGVHMLGPFCMAAAFIPDYLWDCGICVRELCSVVVKSTNSHFIGKWNPENKK